MRYGECASDYTAVVLIFILYLCHRIMFCRLPFDVEKFWLVSEHGNSFHKQVQVFLDSLFFSFFFLILRQ